MFSAHATNSIINLEAVKIWDVHGCEGVNKGFVSKNSKKKKTVMLDVIHTWMVSPCNSTLNYGCVRGFKDA